MCDGVIYLLSFYHIFRSRTQTKWTNEEAMIYPEEDVDADDNWLTSSSSSSCSPSLLQSPPISFFVNNERNGQEKWNDDDDDDPFLVSCSSIDNVFEAGVKDLGEWNTTVTKSLFNAEQVIETQTTKKPQPVHRIVKRCTLVGVQKKKNKIQGPRVERKNIRVSHIPQKNGDKFTTKRVGESISVRTTIGGGMVIRVGGDNDDEAQSISNASTPKRVCITRSWTRNSQVVAGRLICGGQKEDKNWDGYVKGRNIVGYSGGSEVIYCRTEGIKAEAVVGGVRLTLP